MTQAIVDPGELRRFAHNLKQFTTELQERLGALQGQMRNLGATWRDQEHLKFAEEFDRTTLVLGRFIEAVDNHIPFLLRKAQRADEYLQQR